MNTRRTVYQILHHLKAAGVTHIPLVKPQPHVSTASGRNVAHAAVGNAVSSRKAGAGAPAPQSASGAVSKGVRAPREAAAQRPPASLLAQAELHTAEVLSPDLHAATSAILATEFESLSEKTEALQKLAGFVSGCTRCQELANTRRQTVFGVGHPDARIMFIGEAPGADEDAQGEPFVGKAGQLLNKIITACQLQRSDIYICNVLRCRPPGNRTPLPQEAANCREFLDAQIHIVRPEYIVCWGSVAAQNLLQDKRPIGRMRGQFMMHQSAKVLCTYHPSYLLRYPAAKAQVWEDMKLLMRDMGVELK